MGLFCGMQLAVWYSGIHFFGGQPFRGNMGTSWGPQLTRWYHPPAVLCLFWDMLGLGSDSFEIVVIYIYIYLCIYVVCICKCICIFICICMYVENINYYYYYYLYIYSIFTLCAYCIAYISLYIYAHHHSIWTHQPHPTYHSPVCESLSFFLLGMHQLSWLSWLIFHNWGTPDLTRL